MDVRINGYFCKKKECMVSVLKKGATKKEMDAINKKLNRVQPRKRLDAKKYLGVIHLKENPLAIQKKLRNEWE